MAGAPAEPPTCLDRFPKMIMDVADLTSADARFYGKTAHNLRWSGASERPTRYFSLSNPSSHPTRSGSG